MNRSIFFDNQALVYVISGFLAYVIGGLLVFSKIRTDEVVLQLVPGNASKPLLVEKRITLKDSVLVDAKYRSGNTFYQDKWFANRHPSFSKWGLFMSLLIAFSGAIFIPAVILIVKMIKDHHLWEYIQKQKWWWAIPTFLVLSISGYLTEAEANSHVFLPTEILRHFELLYENWWQREVFTYFIKAVAFTCLTGIVVLIFVISWRNKEANEDEMEEARLQKDLTSYFYFFAACSSIIIAGGVITSVLLRDLVFSLVRPLDESVRNSDAYKQLVPASFHITYGLNFTIILATLLIPTRRYLKKSGQLALARILLRDPNAGLEIRASLRHEEDQLKENIWFAAIILLPFIALFVNRVFSLLELL